MNYSEWAPIYQTILKRFGFSEADDEKTALWLSEKFKDNPTDSISILNEKIAGKRIIICGNAPSLEKEILDCQLGRRFENSGIDTLIAADGAAAVLMKNGILPDIIVTDLDGKNADDADKEIEAADIGALLLVHAHGDNLETLEKYWPQLSEKIETKRIIPTCQCFPPAHLYNFGGFTDGDRCAYLACAFGAAEILLLGFDFEDRNVTALKRKKLECARILIERLCLTHPKIKISR